MIVIPGAKANTGISINPNAVIERAYRGSFKQQYARYNEASNYTPLQRSALAQAWYALKLSGVLDKCSVFCAKGNYPSNADATLNWYAEGPAQTRNGDPTMTQKGYALDGVDDYIGTGVTPSSAPRWTLNSAHAALLIGDDGDSMESGKAMMALIGGSSTFLFYPFANSGRNSIAGRLNNDTSVSVNLSGSRRGVLLMNRISDAGVSFYFNGQPLGFVAAPSTTLGPTEMVVGRTNSEWNPGTVAGWSAGTGLSLAQIDAHTTAMLAMLDAFSS